ncbi:MAG: cysteine desulfurase, partial [Proteobacteria bacterium]|nr:cysteine desulfurase [Pseudomonadota bacterium]
MSQKTLNSSLSKLDLDAIRRDFPILSRQVRDGKNLVYLDNAATTLKPRQVLDVVYD